MTFQRDITATFLSVTDTYVQSILIICVCTYMYVRTYAYHENRSLIQSLALMRSAIIPRHHITLSLYHSPHAGVPPVFITVPSPPASLVFEGSNIIYHCTAKGFPPPRIIWQHENTYIQSVQHQDGENTTSIVNLLEVGGGDSGVYSCIAISELQGRGVGTRDFPPPPKNF